MRSCAERSGIDRSLSPGWHPARYNAMPPPQIYPHGNGHRYSTDTYNRPPSDQYFQPNHQRGRMAGPSRLPYGGPPPDRVPMRRRSYRRPPRNRPVVRANSVDVPPTAPNPDSGEDFEQTRAVAATLLPFTISPNQGMSHRQAAISFLLIQSFSVDQDRSRSPTVFWEDNYEQREEEPTPAVRKHFLQDTHEIQSANEPSAPASPSSENVAMSGEYPWHRPGCIPNLIAVDRRSSGTESLGVTYNYLRKLTHFKIDMLLSQCCRVCTWIVFNLHMDCF
jgi:hypothetical protein